MLKELIKKYTTRGLFVSLRNVRTEFTIHRLHQAGKRRARNLVGGEDLKLHFGCGSTIKAGFINIDLGDKADLRLDVREPIPFPANSCSMVYSEHFLEHLGYPDEAIFFLSECSRVLRPGGLFSVGVPDAEWPLRAYAGDPYYTDWFQYVIEHGYPKSQWITTKMECVNYSFRQGEEHKFAYDFETLKRALEMVGLGDVRRREFNPSLDSEKSRYSLESDKSKCTTLYVDANKPEPRAAKP
jgi:predicted SAM-dependent methyltransferase